MPVPPPTTALGNRPISIYVWLTASIGIFFIVKYGVAIRNKPLSALARDISATDFSFIASSSSFFDAKLPIESITTIT